MKSFNVTGVCIPEKHYMVDVSDRIQIIKDTLINQGKYFTINRARQYGKTTTLYMLEKALQDEYVVISLSFEAADDLFQSRYHFATGFIKKVSKRLNVLGVESNIVQKWEKSISKEMPFEDLNDRITALCQSCSKKIVLMLDEVDKSSDNQIFLSFLGLLRTKYLDMQKGEDSSFYSVILAGVYDIKNLKLKYRNGEEEKYNSPWNAREDNEESASLLAFDECSRDHMTTSYDIAADFGVDMSFSTRDIATMLVAYEQEHHTGMVISAIANELYAYTSGYPYLVSRLCQLIDENMQNSISWDHQGILAAVRLLLKDKNTLFDDIQKKLTDFPQLRDMLYAMLFQGITYPYHANSSLISVGEDFGFIKERNNHVVVANRIYEIWLYNLFIAEDALHDKTYEAGLQARNIFVQNGCLNMDLVMQKFLEHFTEVYANSTDTFVEENGRRLFLLYLKPIINGTGNYYIESRTISMGRTDVIIDYLGKRYVVELKIWHGDEYNERGEKQLIQYLDDYHLKRGYLLSFNFNKKKKVGLQEMHFADKTIVEVVV